MPSAFPSAWLTAASQNLDLSGSNLNRGAVRVHCALRAAVEGLHGFVAPPCYPRAPGLGKSETLQADDDPASAV